jgi:hypothetical protein
LLSGRYDLDNLTTALGGILARLKHNWFTTRLFFLVKYRRAR